MNRKLSIADNPAHSEGAGHAPSKSLRCRRTERQQMWTPLHTQNVQVMRLSNPFGVREIEVNNLWTPLHKQNVQVTRL